MNIRERSTNILTNPAAEWDVIAQERADVPTLLREYAAPLAAIPAVCRLFGMTVVGSGLPFAGTFRIGIVRGIAMAFVAWVMSLVGAYIAAWVIDRLAPTFQSSGGMIQALKLVVYAQTPFWIAGVLNLIPALAGLTILAALYAAYLFYLGLAPIMETPADRAVPYMLTSALVIVGVAFVLGFVATTVAGVGAYASF